jgi:hypothetical protein
MWKQCALLALLASGCLTVRERAVVVYAPPNPVARLETPSELRQCKAVGQAFAEIAFPSNATRTLKQQAAAAGGNTLVINAFNPPDEPEISLDLESDLDVTDCFGANIPRRKRGEPCCWVTKEPSVTYGSATV